MKKFTILFLMMILSLQLLQARSWRVNQIPNGQVNRCANCHVNPNGGGPRNAFGQAISNDFIDKSGNVIWNSRQRMRLILT